MPHVEVQASTPRRLALWWSSHSSLIALAAVAVSLLLAGGYAVLSGSTLAFYDEREYLALAQSVADGHGYVNGNGDPTAYRPPGYPLLLAPVHWITGGNVVALRLVGVLSYAGAVWLAYLLGRRAHSAAVGALAAVVLAVYPLVLYTSTTLYPQVPAMFLLMLTIETTIRCTESRRVTTAIGAGLAAGALTLVIPTFAPGLLILYGWLLWRARTGRPSPATREPNAPLPADHLPSAGHATSADGISAAGQVSAVGHVSAAGYLPPVGQVTAADRISAADHLPSAEPLLSSDGSADGRAHALSASASPRRAATAKILAIALVAAAVLPAVWIVRNAVVMDAFIPVATNSGTNLLLGNSDKVTAGGGRVGDISAYEKQAEQQGMDELEQNAFYTEQATAWIKENPGRAAALYAGKVVNTFAFRNELATAGQSNTMRDLVSALTYYPILALAVVRLLLARRFPLRGVEKVLLWTIITNVLLLAVFFTRIRFRVPLDALTILLAASAVGYLLQRWFTPAPQETEVAATTG